MRSLLIAASILAAIYVVLVGSLAVSGRKLAAKELVALLPNLLRRFRDLSKDGRVPRRAKVVLALAAVWLISPIDLLPEFLPVLGPLDDAVVGVLALRYLVKRAGPAVVREHWRGEPATLEAMMRAARIPVSR
jgi:uncharacterized membrane protein YkvA (DUF1232 family)